MLLHASGLELCIYRHHDHATYVDSFYLTESALCIQWVLFFKFAFFRASIRNEIIDYDLLACIVVCSSSWRVVLGMGFSNTEVEYSSWPPHKAKIFTLLNRFLPSGLMATVHCHSA